MTMEIILAFIAGLLFFAVVKLEKIEAHLATLAAIEKKKYFGSGS